MVESSANITVAPLSLLTGQLQPIWLDRTIRFRRQGHGGLGLGILTASLTFCRCAPAAGTSLCVCEAGLRSHRLRGLPDHRDRRSRKLTCAYWLADSWLRMPSARRDCCSVGAAVVGLSAGAVATCHRDRGKYQSATLKLRAARPLDGDIDRRRVTVHGDSWSVQLYSGKGCWRA